MKHELWYSVVVRDRQGKVVSRERRKSRSFLKAWNQLVYLQVAGVGITIKDTGGVNRSINPWAVNFQMIGPAGNDDYGIRVGTGNTPVDIADFALETPINEGVAAGQMEHLISTVDDSVVSPPACSFVAHRTIANNSGGLITVREAVIYTKMTSATYYGCVIRDILAVPQGVPDGGSITIDWTIGVTV